MESVPVQARGWLMYQPPGFDSQAGTSTGSGSVEMEGEARRAVSPGTVRLFHAPPKRERRVKWQRPGGR